MRRATRLTRWCVLVAMAAMPIVIAVAIAQVRGPFYLEINTDPEYAYLLNALLVAEGRSPSHTDHPGTPVQVLGAAVIRSVLLAAGRGPLRDDVLLRPELYLRAFQAVVIGVTGMLSLLGGWLALRATGSLLHAVLVQAAPLLSPAAAVNLDRVQPEPLLLGLAVALAGAVLHAFAAPDRPARAPALMGLLAGLGVAAKVLFAPLALIPLVALAGWRARATYAVAGAVTLALALLPIAPALGRTVRWLRAVATHAGKYGDGDRAMLDVRAYPRELQGLILREPWMAAIGAAGLLIVGAAMLLRRWKALRQVSVVAPPDPAPARAARTLAAVGLVQLGTYVIVAKHPADHYLAAAAGISGLGLSLGAILVVAARPRWHRAVGVFALVLLVFAAHARWGSVLERRDVLVPVVSGGRPVGDFMASSEALGVMHGARISTLQSALSFGNYFAGGRLGVDLERLYPDAVTLDWTGIHAFGRALPPEELLARYPSGDLDVLVSVWHQEKWLGVRPDLLIWTGRSFGRERLLRATHAPGLESLAAFVGFESSTGLGRPEGPTAGRPFTVRWGLGPETMLALDAAGGPAVLAMEARPNNLPGQTMEVVVNGSLVHRHLFAGGEFVTIAPRVELRPGRNEVTLVYGALERAGARDLGVLFKSLRIVPAGGP